MKILGSLFVLILMVTSCGSGNDQNVMRTKITAMEDSIAVLTGNLKPGEQLSTDVNTGLVELLLSYYRTYQDDAYAPECLDKVHMVYAAMSRYELSTKYADTLLLNYKDYINRPMILESQASTYDIFLQPRDTAKVRYYNELLLKENPDLPKDKVEGINFRLQNLDLTMEEIIMKQIGSN